MNFLRTALPIMIAVGMTACSSSNVVKVPTPLAELDSPLKIDRNWHVQMNSMTGLSESGLNIAANTDRVFVADAQGMVSALYKDNRARWTEQVQWQVQLSEAIVSGPVLKGEVLIIGTAKGKLIALSAESGEALWQTQLSSEVISRATLGDGRIFTRTVDGRLYALNDQNGEVIWVTQHKMPNLSLRGAAPVLLDKGVLYVGWESGKVEALSAESGKSLWESRIAVPRGRTDLERMVDIQSSLKLSQGRLIALGYQGKLVAINPETGNPYYALDVSGFRDFVVDDNAVYVVDEEDGVYAYALSNGTKLWSQNGLKYRVLADLTTQGDKLLALDGQGYLHWLDKTHGTLVARVKQSNDYGDENRIVRARIEGDTIYLLDSDGTVNSYQISLSNLAQFQDMDPQMVMQSKPQ